MTLVPSCLSVFGSNSRFHFINLSQESYLMFQITATQRSASDEEEGQLLKLGASGLEENIYSYC